MGYSEQDEKGLSNPKGVNRRMIHSVINGVRTLDKSQKGVSLNELVKYIRSKILDTGRCPKYNVDSLIASSLEKAVTEKKLEVFGGRYFYHSPKDDFDLEYPNKQEYPQDAIMFDSNCPLTDDYEIEPPEDRRRGRSRNGGGGCGRRGGRRKRKKSSKIRICYYRKYHNRNCGRRKRKSTKRRKKRC